MRLNRAGEIDYYEELGVERTASPEQIRDAFRALVRLLHPDQQTDEHLKSIAEMQMRKVNRIYAVLSDADRRRRYDEMLEDDFLPAAVVFNPAARNITAKALVTRFVWMGVAMLAVALVIWFATDSASIPSFGTAQERASTQERTPASSRPAGELPEQPVPAEITPAPETSGSQDQIAHLKSELRAARLERDEARRELAEVKVSAERSERAAYPPSETSGPLTAASTSIAELSAPRSVSPASRANSSASSSSPNSSSPSSSSPNNALRIRLPGSDPHQFAGFWFFARNTQPRNKLLYPPEFIEATLTEQNGVVHGKYRSRYQVVDRAISPDVNFEFTGSPAGPVITCAWTGQGGAKGQLTLHMTDENSIKLDWTASELGSVQGLSSGTATLTRRLE